MKNKGRRGWRKQKRTKGWRKKVRKILFDVVQIDRFPNTIVARVAR